MRPKKEQKHPRGNNSSMKRNSKANESPPLKICKALDEEANARSEEILIDHIASNLEGETLSLRFDELDQPTVGVAAARNASARDVLAVLVRDDRMLRNQVRS
jgi:hypothetical protein